MLLNTSSSIQPSSLPDLDEQSSEFSAITAKAYFEDNIVAAKNIDMTLGFINTIDDFFLASTGISLLLNTDYKIDVYNRMKEQPDYGVLERDGFTDIETSVLITNQQADSSFLFEYRTQSEMITFSFQKACDYDFKKKSMTVQKEMSGATDIMTFYTLTFCQLILNYLKYKIIDLEITNCSLLRH